MNRRICVVTGTRAEYGLLRWVMEEIRDNANLELQVIVTGMHLSPEFGLTFSEIEKDGFKINRKVEMLLSSDTSTGIAKSIGLGIIGFSDAIEQLQPDLIIVLGDRFEIFSAVASAMVSRIPVAHLHGGEATEGLIDESIRHSITKMSHLHFVAAEEYRRRVIQLGEQPDRVFNVGGLGLDNLQKLALLEKDELEKGIDFKFGSRNLLVTYHPVTLEKETSSSQMTELFAALDRLDDTHIIFTMPNADADGRILFEMVNNFVSNHKNSKAYISLGQIYYLSCIKYVDAVIGNSSSGLIEVPSFHKGTVNIGDRQRGRLKAESVVDCQPDEASISQAIKVIYSDTFKNKLKYTKNLYGDGGASRKIIDIIEKFPLENILKKQFFDLPGS